MAWLTLPWRYWQTRHWVCECRVEPPVGLDECPECARPSLGQIDHRRKVRAEFLAAHPPSAEGALLLLALEGPL